MASASTRTNTNTNLAVKRTFGGKVKSYFEQNPGKNEVIFEVGPRKERIVGNKIFIQPTCPALDREIMSDNGGGGSGSKNKPILLPLLDPRAFQIFLELLILDDWPIKEIEQRKLNLATLLDLITVSHKLEMNEFNKIFTAQAYKVFREFSSFSKSPDFLALSREHLELTLSSDLRLSNEVDIFKAACQWAKNQCNTLKLDAKDGSNIRKVLGGALFKIRFPIMSARDFVKNVSVTGILTIEERVQLLEYIALKESNSSPQNSCGTLFNTQERREFPALTLQLLSPDSVRLFKNLQFLSNPPFVCDGTFNKNSVLLSVSHKVMLESVGFLGPINKDEFYDVFLRVYKRSPHIPGAGGYELVGDIEKKVHANPERVFYATFNKPIVLEPVTSSTATNQFSPESEHYCFEFHLKGPNTQSVNLINGVDLCKELIITVDGVIFRSRHKINQLAELTFRKC